MSHSPIPMLRRLFIILSTLSLLLCGITLAFWLRSYLYTPLDGITFAPKDGGVWEIAIRSNAITIGHASPWPHPAVFDYVEFTRDTVRRGTHLDIGAEECSYFQWPLLPVSGWIRPATHYLYRLDNHVYTEISRSPTPISGWYAVFPCWLPAILFSLLPLSRLLLAARRSLLRRLRHRRGLCPTCGYDLRASSHRCPECGTPIIPQPSPSPEKPASRWARPLPDGIVLRPAALALALFAWFAAAILSPSAWIVAVVAGLLACVVARRAARVPPFFRVDRFFLLLCLILGASASLLNLLDGLRLLF